MLYWWYNIDLAKPSEAKGKLIENIHPCGIINVEAIITRLRRGINRVCEFFLTLFGNAHVQILWICCIIGMGYGFMPSQRRWQKALQPFIRFLVAANKNEYL